MKYFDPDEIVPSDLLWSVFGVAVVLLVISVMGLLLKSGYFLE